MRIITDILNATEQAIALFPVNIWLAGGLLVLESALIVFFMYFARRHFKGTAPLAIQACALALGMLPIVRFWPYGWEAGIYVGLAAALFWSAAYGVLMNMLRRRYSEFLPKQ